MMQDIGASVDDVCKVLNVSRASVYRWLSVGKMPRSAMLALYWLTSWGQRSIAEDVHERMRLATAMSQAMGREIRSLRSDLDRLSKIGHYGSANDPTERTAAAFGLDDAATVEAMRPQKPRSHVADLGRFGHDGPDANKQIRADGPPRHRLPRTKRVHIGQDSTIDRRSMA